MIYTPHMGIENIAKITLNANCSFKINMKKRTQNGEEGHNLVVETCLKSGTNCFLYYNTTFKKNSKITCTNLVLVLRGEKIFYSMVNGTLQNSLAYSTYLLWYKIPCLIVFTAIKILLFIVLYSQYEIIYGSVVDIKTGRFLYGNKCSKMFKKAKYKHFTGKRGIEFVISKFFDKNENIKFPVYKDEGNSTRHHRPMYIKEDGTKPKSLENLERNTVLLSIGHFILYFKTYLATIFV
ncbi:hypothetical protein Avbf_10808 [Armadillidium vulgare]|nr:hypothetical protein Avbf_10808 [Armadillidium vulgare]